MTPEMLVLRQRLLRVITRHSGSSPEVSAVAVAARVTHAELTAVMAPLISSAGVEALWGRAFDVARREYPTGERKDDSATTDEPFAQVTLWLESQAPSAAPDAAAAIFATFAQLLTTLIGGALTTRYLAKAWPDGFSDVQVKGKKA